MNRQLRPLRATLALALVLGIASQARAQDAGPVKHYHSKTSFRIPVEIDDAERAQLSELRLYVKAGNSEWSIAANGPATERAFMYQAKRDGEYWFNIATVDREGNMSPANPRQQEPALIVVVDTIPPNVEVKPMTSGDRVYLQCKIIDPHPDYQSIRVQYQKSDGSWAPLEGLANLPGVVQVPDPRLLDGRVRVHAADRAGNVVEREIDLNSARIAGPPPVLPSMPQDKLLTQEEMAPVKVAGGPEPLAPGIRSVSDTKPAADPLAAPLPPPIDPLTAPTISDKRPLPPAIVNLPSDNMPAAPQAPAVDPLLHSPDLAGSNGKSAIINTNRCRIDFALDPVPGGIAEVEVWASTDGCRTWKPVGVSKDGKSPAVVDFPGEGKYAIAFVVRPNMGLPSALPKAGDTPDGYLEIDTTLPVADLTAVVPGTGADAGFVLINWVAKDANLDEAGISCWYATQPGGPWQLIAERLPNTSSYRWQLPRGVGSQVWVRLEARDRAGNVTRCETTQPVALEGPRAKVRVLGIGPARD